MKIDSHQHFWIVRRFDYPWMSPKLGVLYRDYLPGDLKPVLQQAGIGKTIVVQASPSVAETDWLLELAAQNDFIAGVVGWLDFEASDFQEQLNRYRRNPKFVGIRPAVEFIPDDEWLIKPRVIEALSIVADADFPMDLIVWPRHLPALVKMLAKVPKLRCVIDHLAKPDVKARQLEPWRTLVAEVAKHPTVHCKLSGILTMADHKHWTARDIQPYVDHVLASFGPDRVMYGSDWPVSLLASSYQQTIDVLWQAVGQSGIKLAQAALFGDNAANFYRLNNSLKGSHASSSS